MSIMLSGFLHRTKCTHSVNLPILAITISLIIGLSTAPAAAASLEIIWEPSPDASAVGYLIHYRKLGEGAWNTTDVKASTQHIFPNVKSLETWVIAISAYDKNGIVGPRSADLLVDIGDLGGGSGNTHGPGQAGAAGAIRTLLLH